MPAATLSSPPASRPSICTQTSVPLTSVPDLRSSRDTTHHGPRRSTLNSAAPCSMTTRVGSPLSSPARLTSRSCSPTS